MSIGADTSIPVVHLPVSTVNTVATHAQFQAYTVFSRIYPAYMYNLHTPIPCTKSHFQYKKFVQPGIGIGIAAADSIGYRVPAQYRSNPNLVSMALNFNGNFRVQKYISHKIFMKMQLVSREKRVKLWENTLSHNVEESFIIPGSDPDADILKFNQVFLVY